MGKGGLSHKGPVGSSLVTISSFFFFCSSILGKNRCGTRKEIKFWIQRLIINSAEELSFSRGDSVSLGIKLIVIVHWVRRGLHVLISIRLSHIISEKTEMPGEPGCEPRQPGSRAYILTLHADLPLPLTPSPCIPAFLGIGQIAVARGRICSLKRRLKKNKNKKRNWGWTPQSLSEWDATAPCRARNSCSWVTKQVGSGGGCGKTTLQGQPLLRWSPWGHAATLVQRSGDPDF